MIKVETSEGPPRPTRHEWRDAIIEADLPDGTKVIAFAICSFASKGSGEAYPSYDTIAKKCRMSADGVHKAVRRLVKAGFLSVRKRGFGGTNLMTLQVPALNSAPSGEIGSVNSAPEGDIGAPNSASPGDIEASNSALSGGSIPPRGAVQFRPVGRSNLNFNQNINPSLPGPRASEQDDQAGEADPRVAQLLAQLGGRMRVGR